MKMQHRLHSIVEGSGPVVMLSHALGCDLGMWDEVAALLRVKHTVVRYDHRGHGASAGADHPFSIEDLSRDAASLIEHLGLGAVHFVGVSMGGMTAQALAANYPQLVKTITVAHAASYYGSDARKTWQARVETVRRYGMAAIADGALTRWLSASYIETNPQRVSELRATLLSNLPLAYSHACEAVANIDLQSSNARICCPALVIAGSQDQATPYEYSEAIAAQIHGAKLEVINSAHIGCVEQPVAFAALVSRLVNHAKFTEAN